MSNEMNQNKGRQTHNKTATENGEPTPKQLLRKRKHRIPLRNLVLSSMGDGDLFGDFGAKAPRKPMIISE